MRYVLSSKISFIRCRLVLLARPLLVAAVLPITTGALVAQGGSPQQTPPSQNAPVVSPSLPKPLPAASDQSSGGIAREGSVETKPLPPVNGGAPATNASPNPSIPAPVVGAPAGSSAPALPSTAPATAAPAASGQSSSTVAPASPPSVQPVPNGAPASPQVAQPSVPTRPTLVPTSGDPSNVDEVLLPDRPVAIISGQTTWDEGFSRLATTIKRLEQELATSGIVVNGRPLSRFVETDDLGFRYDIMLPVQAAPTAGSPVTLKLPAEIRFGALSAAKAIRFTHKAPYEEIDGTYEAITAYLDAKGLTVNDSFLEEYVTDLTNPNDAALEINIFVTPK